MMQERHSVSLKILVLLTVVCSMALLASLLLYQGFKNTERNLLHATSITAKHLANTANFSIKATLDPAMLTMRMLSHHSLAEATTLEERLPSLPMLAEIIKSNELFNAIYVGYQNGDFFMLRQYAGDIPLLTQPVPERTAYLVQSVERDATGAAKGTLLLYSAGLQLLETRSLPEYRFDPRERSWFKLANASETIEITSPYLFYSTKEIGLTMALQAEGRNAVFGLDSTIKNLGKLLETLRLSNHAEVAIVDPQGRLVAYPDMQRLLVQKGDSLQLADLKTLNVPILSTLNDQKDATGQTTFRLHDGTQEWFGFKENISALGTDDFTMLVAIPAQELLAQAWTNVYYQMAVAAGLALVVTALSMFISRAVIIDPVTKLRNQISALENFDFTQPVGVSTVVREVQELGKVLGNMAAAIGSFQAISLALNKEQNLEKMLLSVLDQLVTLTKQEYGAVYLLDDSGNHLVPFVHKAGHPLENVLLPGANPSDEELLAFIQQSNPGTDIHVILRNREQDLTGLLVLGGGQEGVALREKLLQSTHRIAGSAAVAIETRQLILAQKALLDSIIKLVADAIDTKSQYTGGHCQRVPVLATMLMDSICTSQNAAFGGYGLTATQKEEFRIAAWLHDCGKITTPEYVVDKATKLETIYNRIHEVRMRFEVLHRDAAIRCLEAIQAGMPLAQAKEECAQEQQALQEEFAFIAKCNIGGEAMSDDDVARLKSISGRIWMRYFDDRLGLSRDELLRTPAHAQNDPLPAPEMLLADKQSHIIPWGERIPPVQPSDPRNSLGFDMKLPACMYNYGEVYNLSIRRGTLTEEERFKINDHIVQTICMLSALPLPKTMKRLPDIAGNHHEKIDGTGYPRRRKGSEMSIAEKVMVLADIFEALTASDRPYKDGKTLSQAMTLLAKMANEQHVDVDIFNHFLQSGIYLDYGKKYLKEKQIDAVDVERFFIQTT